MIIHPSFSYNKKTSFLRGFFIMETILIMENIYFIIKKKESFFKSLCLKPKSYK